MAYLDKKARQIFLWEFVQAFLLSMRYFFAPKVTLNYPFEKAPQSPRYLNNLNKKTHFKSFPGLQEQVLLEMSLFVL